LMGSHGNDQCAFIDGGVPRLDIPSYTWCTEARVLAALWLCAFHIPTCFAACPMASILHERHFLADRENIHPRRQCSCACGRCQTFAPQLPPSRCRFPSRDFLQLLSVASMRVLQRCACPWDCTNSLRPFSLALSHFSTRRSATRLNRCVPTTTCVTKWKRGI
jgi:hypothetical protein